MFTGIIEDLGKVESIIRYKDRAEITIATRLAADINVSDSVCVNGVCLTAAKKSAKSFTADIVKETLKTTSLTLLKFGEHVNLERAVRASGRFDGHMVLGHADCRSAITGIVNKGAEREIEIDVPETHRKYLVEKGSIAVDGVSLTVASLSDRSFRVAVIPHTAQITNLFHKKVGGLVNLEFDVLAKYAENLLRCSTR